MDIVFISFYFISSLLFVVCVYVIGELSLALGGGLELSEVVCPVGNFEYSIIFDLFSANMSNDMALSGKLFTPVCAIQFKVGINAKIVEILFLGLSLITYVLWW